jgi:hypothetical protein
MLKWGHKPGTFKSKAHLKAERRRDHWRLEAAPSPSTPVHVSGVARVMATRTRGGAGSAGGAEAAGASASTCVGGIAPASRVASVVGATVGVASAGHGPLQVTSDDRVLSPVGGCGTARDPVRSLETEVDPLSLFGRNFFHRIRIAGFGVREVSLDVLRHLPVGGCRRVDRVGPPQRS